MLDERSLVATSESNAMTFVEKTVDRRQRFGDVGSLNGYAANSRITKVSNRTFLSP